MAILLKTLICFVSAVLAGKLICLQHILFKYNRLLQQFSENYAAVLPDPANGVYLLF